MKLNYMNLKNLKNNIYFIVRNIITVLIILNLFIPNTSCNYIKYGKAIQIETGKIMSERKQLINNLQFTGTLYKKINCKKCKINRYVIMLKLDTLSIRPNIEISNYQPYYVFYSDTILQLSVLQNLYDKIQIGDIIIKNKNKNNILIENNLFEILSEDENKWFPE